MAPRHSKPRGPSWPAVLGGPVGLLVLMAVAMPLAFPVREAMLNNFVMERAGFTGVEIGWLQTLREIPGLLSVSVILVHVFGWVAAIAAGLYVIDHVLLAMALSFKTYVQKIADPGDFAPTAVVAFTINDIAAVVLPAALGYPWVVSPGGVFYLAAAIALISLALALMNPRHPEPGRETVFARGPAIGAAAE